MTSCVNSLGPPRWDEECKSHMGELQGKGWGQEGEEIAELASGWLASLRPVEDRGSLGKVLEPCSSRKVSPRLMRRP